MKRILLNEFYKNSVKYADQKVTVCGWIRTLRDSKAFGFIELNDGSCFKSVQVVFEADKVANYEEIAKLNVGSSVIVVGTFVLTPQNKQPFEIKATMLATISAISITPTQIRNPNITERKIIVVFIELI